MHNFYQGKSDIKQLSSDKKAMEQRNHRKFQRVLYITLFFIHHLHFYQVKMVEQDGTRSSSINPIESHLLRKYTSITYE